MSFTKTQNKFSKGIDDKADGTAVTIDENGAVGVGASNPAGIGGGADLAVIKPGGARFVINGKSRNWFIRGDSGVDDLRVGLRGNTDTTDGDMVVITTTSVGIGTDDPQAKLEINDGTQAVGSAASIAPDMLIRGTGPTGITVFTDATSAGAISFGKQGESTELRWIKANNADNSMTFGKGNQTQVTIDADGDVGVGTDPIEKLTVTGNINLNPASTSSADRLAPIYIGKRDSGTAGWMANIGFEGVGSNGFATHMTFSTRGGDNYNSGTAERMRITSTGNVGIGTLDADNAGLVVEKKAGGSTNASAAFKSNVDTYLRIARFGTGADSGMSIGNNYSRPSGFSADNSAYPVHQIAFSTDGSLVFGTGPAGSDVPTERMRIDVDGNVTSTSGGGTLTTTGLVTRYMGSSVADVAAYRTGASDAVLTFSTTSGAGQPTEKMRIDADGRVDITGSLYVNGTAKIGYSELITTLVTLRKATQDETTLEGLRDSIGNAIGGLIEKFEAEIAAMPAPEVGTMDITE